MQTKPNLTIIGRDAEKQMMINLFKKLTGREPTAEEIAEADGAESVDTLPSVHFGPVTEERGDLLEHDDIDADDEELDHTPASVVAVLGFDPADED